MPNLYQAVLLVSSNEQLPVTGQWGLPGISTELGFAFTINFYKILCSKARQKLDIGFRHGPWMWNSYWYWSMFWQYTVITVNRAKHPIKSHSFSFRFTSRHIGHFSVFVCLVLGLFTRRCIVVGHLACTPQNRVQPWYFFLINHRLSAVGLRPSSSLSTGSVVSLRGDWAIPRS